MATSLRGSSSKGSIVVGVGSLFRGFSFSVCNSDFAPAIIGDAILRRYRFRIRSA
jgi:hypothetical protein